MASEGGECTRTAHIHHRCLLLLGLVTINVFVAGVKQHVVAVVLR